jgi:hypothetical protein
MKMPADPGLFPSERAERYRDLAGEAERQAAKRTGEISEGYHLLAEKWRELARYVEANSDNELRVSAQLIKQRPSPLSPPLR